MLFSSIRPEQVNIAKISYMYKEARLTPTSPTFVAAMPVAQLIYGLTGGSLKVDDGGGNTKPGSLLMPFEKGPPPHCCVVQG